MKDARKVQSMCQQMIVASLGRMQNYARLNDLYNGGLPWTPEEAQSDHQHTNVNWLEGTEKVHEAISQAKNALKSTENFFTVKIETGSPHKRREWGMTITKEINRVLKRSRSYRDTIDASVTQMVVQGIGPATWMKRDDWCPKARRIDEMLMPSGTLTSLDNLSHFAVRITLTAAELIRQTTGKTVDKGWNQKLAGPLINRLCKASPGQQNINYSDNPVTVMEDFKENGAFFQSDAVPVLHCFDFYYLDQAKGEWFRKIVVDAQSNSFSNTEYQDQYLYDNPHLSYGTDSSMILTAQIADGSVVAPSRWWATRSLGYMLFPMCMAQNRLRCKLWDATWESLLMLFRATSTGDHELIQKVDLRQHGIVPDGLKWVPANERQTVNYELVSGMLAMNRQLISENASSFTQDVNDGTAKEQTATEVMARVSSANKLQSSMLSNIYEQQVPQYREIARRFCKSRNKDCVEFRKRCQAAGVDPAAFDSETWEIIPEKSMGAGDRMIQMAMGDKLMALSPRMNPTAQQAALHIAVEATTGDSDMANELAPLSKTDPSPAAEKATLAWGTLIDGKPVILAGDINRIEFVETLLKLVDIEFKRINLGGGGLPSPERVDGLENVLNVLNGVVQQIATDESQAERVRGYMQAIGKGANYVKAYRQQLEQQAQAQGDQQDPQMAADIRAKEIIANSDATIDEHLAEQKLRHKEVGFHQDQARKDAKTAAEITAAGARTQVELAGASARNRLQQEAQINKSTQ